MIGAGYAADRLHSPIFDRRCRSNVFTAISESVAATAAPRLRSSLANDRENFLNAWKSGGISLQNPAASTTLQTEFNYCSAELACPFSATLIYHGPCCFVLFPFSGRIWRKIEGTVPVTELEWFALYRSLYPVMFFFSRKRIFPGDCRFSSDARSRWENNALQSVPNWRPTIDQCLINQSDGKNSRCAAG